MTDKELLQQALDALISVWNSDRTTRQVETIRAIKARLTQPEPEHMTQFKFQDYGWWRDEEGKLKLGTMPQQKEWVGLTEEDIDDAEIHLTACRNNHESWIEGIQEFAQAIEAKLKEKNT